MRTLVTWLLVALAFFVLPYIIPGITIHSFKTALIIAALWGLINLLVKPIISLVLLPITLMTLGLFSFVFNALLFWGMAWLAQVFHIDFSVSGFMPALWGSLLISLVGFIAHKAFSEQ